MEDADNKRRRAKERKMDKKREEEGKDRGVGG